MEIFDMEPWILIARIFDRIINNMEKNNINHTLNTDEPIITMHEYLKELCSHSICSDSCFIIAFIYIDNILKTNPQFKLTLASIHKIVLGAINLASKYYDDEHFGNYVYSKIGNISLSEFNNIEQVLLALMDYEVYIDKKIYFEYYNELRFQYLKIVEEDKENAKNQDKANGECINTLKTIQSVESMTSIKTLSSNI